MAQLEGSPSVTFRGLQLLVACLIWGIVNCPEQKDLVHHESRIMKDSILFSLNIIPGEKSHLDFQSRSRKMHELAVFTNGKWEPTKTNNRFGQRLVMVSETMLRIMDLKKEDSGLFKFRVRLHPPMVLDLIFNLTVYAPVPKPRILSVSNTSDRCSITLWCLVDGEERYNISWEIKGTLNGNWDPHQFSDNNSSLRLSWDPERSNFNVTCVVSNPVDRNTASFDPLKICPPKDYGNEHDENKWFYHLIGAVIAGLILVIIIIVAIYFLCRCWTRRNKRKKGPQDYSNAENSSVDQLISL